MPKPDRFLQGFNVYTNLVIANYKLTHIGIGHDTISRFHKYQYPMKLYFQYIGNGISDNNSTNNLISSFQNYVNGDRIINSEYGNPYQCNFGHIQLLSSSGNNVVLQSLGNSIRV